MDLDKTLQVAEKLIKLPTSTNCVGIKITDHDRGMDNLRLS